MFDSDPFVLTMDRTTKENKAFAAGYTNRAGINLHKFMTPGAEDGLLWDQKSSHGVVWLNADVNGMKTSVYAMGNASAQLFMAVHSNNFGSLRTRTALLLDNL